MARIDIKQHLLNNAVYYLLILLAAWGLKHHYSRAGVEELAWVLAPTAGLVELIGGIQFAYESHTGFISRECRIIIAPACAGVNFLIIAFCMAAFAGLHAIARHRAKLVWLCLGFLSAYLLTILANTIRILISIYSHQMDLQMGWLTAARVHRLEGIVIYFFFLSLFYMIINKITYRFHDWAGAEQKTLEPHGSIEADNRKPARTGLIPLGWYILITLGVPLANGSLQRQAARFAEHSAMVLAAAAAVLLIMLLVRTILQQVQIRRRHF